MKPQVSETMSTDLITIGWTERMSTAFQRMRNEGIRHLPVHDDLGEIVGMLSDRDVQRAMVSTIERGWASSTETAEFSPDARVRDYMSWPAIVVDVSGELRSVAERMVGEKVSSLLVREKGRIIGIITAEDLLKVLISILSDPGASSRWSLGDLVDRSSSRLERSLI